MSAFGINMNFQEQEELREYENIRNTRKLILLENWDDLGLTNNKRKEFVKYYYNNLNDMGIVEALNEFKKLK